MCLKQWHDEFEEIFKSADGEIRTRKLNILSIQGVPITSHQQNGAVSGSRTRRRINPPSDFKSDAYTNSAMTAKYHAFIHI